VAFYCEIGRFRNVMESFFRVLTSEQLPGARDQSLVRQNSGGEAWGEEQL